MVGKVSERRTSRYLRQYMLPDEAKIAMRLLIIPDAVLEVCGKLRRIHIRGSEVNTEPVRCAVCDV